MIDQSVATDAQKNIGSNWAKLSAGDVSTIKAALSQDDAGVLTTQDTPHWYFWTQMVRLDWAIKQDLPSALQTLPLPIAVFKLTGLGKKMLPNFMNKRNLLP